MESPRARSSRRLMPQSCSRADSVRCSAMRAMQRMTAARTAWNRYGAVACRQTPAVPTLKTHVTTPMETAGACPPHLLQLRLNGLQLLLFGQQLFCQSRPWASQIPFLDKNPQKGYNEGLNGILKKKKKNKKNKKIKKKMMAYENAAANRGIRNKALQKNHLL